MESISVVLPTYNEAENISSMLSELLSVAKKNNYDLKIHVVDDESPDGTSDIVKGLSAEHPNINLVSGKKEGLGKAYLRGFDHALMNHDPDIVIMMDCDFSHDPYAIPSLVDEVRTGHDYVIGSRYARGGAIPGDWPIKRIINSKVANVVATKVGGIDPSIKDISGGFKAINAQSLRSVGYRNINTYGYGFQMHLLHLFLINNKRVKEVPIVFKDRTHGESKMRFSDIVGFLKCAYGLSPDSQFKQLLRFASVGISGIFVNLAVLFLLKNYTDLNIFLSSAIAIEISIISNFFFHSIFTFGNIKSLDSTLSAPMPKSTTKILFRFIKFNAATLVVGVITLLTFSIFHGALSMHYLVAQSIAIGLSFFLNYWFSKRFIWGDRVSG